jgi:hypothetical protein
MAALAHRRPMSDAESLWVMTLGLKVEGGALAS